MKKIFTLIALAVACLQGNAMDYSNPANNDYVREWGKLKLVGNQLSSESGEPIQLRGWSTHGKNWQGGCFDDKGDFELMKQKGANLARIAMYLKEGGYEDINWMKQCIEWTNSLGMYCIVDWHILTPGNPNAGDYSGAENFFRSISGWIVDNNYKNVIYEICNEPNIDEEGDPYRPDVWEWVKKYANKILPAIAEKDKDAVVVVGTPQWDKALSFPMEDPIDTYGLNVMYTFHHYTCDQQFFLGILSGAAASIPVFVTEWGVSKDDGGADGQVCTGDADKMLAVCNGKNLGNQIISWANWSWSADSRSSSAFSSYPNSMKESGQYVESQLKKGDQFQKSISTPYEDPQVFDGENDLILALEKYDKGGHNEAYYDFDREDWWNCTACNAGDLGEENFRPGEYVDIGYTDKNDKANSYKNLGYIVNGEWVKYTIDVKHAGVYEFELYACNHIDKNIVGISVDGENALVNDKEGTDETVRAFYLDQCNGGNADAGYDEWGWVKPVASPEADDKWSNTKFYINFKKPGEQVLGLAFLTANSGLGALKLIGIDRTGNANVPAEAVSVWPNPANGSFNVSVAETSEVKVANAQGAVVYLQEVEGNATVNLQAAPGVYFITVSNNSGVVTKKLIVK